MLFFLFILVVIIIPEIEIENDVLYLNVLAWRRKNPEQWKNEDNRNEDKDGAGVAQGEGGAAQAPAGDVNSGQGPQADLVWGITFILSSIFNWHS